MANYRVIADAGNKNIPTVNILTSQVASAGTSAHPHKGHTQVTAAQASAFMSGQVKTVQASGGTIAGLPTIVIPGYSAPN